MDFPRISRLTRTTLVVALLLSAVSCLDKINLPAPAGTADALVIQAKLLKGEPSVLRVQINRLFDFTAGTTLPVNVTLVEIEDEQGVVVRVPEAALGVYQLVLPDDAPQLEVAFGKQYRLHVIARDGRDYVTGFEPLWDVPEPESIRLDTIQIPVVNEIGEFDVIDRFQFSISTPIRVPGAAEKSYLKWDVERTFKVTDTPLQPTTPVKTCYVTQNVVGSNLNVLNGNDFSAEAVTDIPISESAITFVYAEGLYLTVYQQSLSATAYEYWEQITQLVERSGNMFEPPAGKIATNFTNTTDPDDQVYGFFYATTQDTIRYYVDPENLNLPPACPPPGGLLNQGGGCAVPLCCNCLSEPGSTTTKPSFWTE
ncbi:MAG: DUF4249 family protein [Saprospiraceae bacterium]|nr:DUF4249 family protein [Saprospiraceae bacterium]